MSKFKFNWDCIIATAGRALSQRIDVLIDYVIEDEIDVRRYMQTYYDDGTLKIRSMVPEDAKILYDTYLSYGWHPQIKVYEDYYKEQEEGERLVFIAEYDGAVKGQCTLVLHPTEGPWGGQDYPEIVDLTASTFDRIVTFVSI